MKTTHIKQWYTIRDIHKATQIPTDGSGEARIRVPLRNGRWGSEGFEKVNGRWRITDEKLFKRIVDDWCREQSTH